jgi:hypothetical protein
MTVCLTYGAGITAPVQNQRLNVKIFFYYWVSKLGMVWWFHEMMTGLQDRDHEGQSGRQDGLGNIHLEWTG